MKTADQLTELFRQQGLRVTPQRQAIFGLLHGDDRHPTVESIYDAARAQMPTISLKTVYQTVNDLAGMGEVVVLDLGTGSFRVDPNVEHSHHHLIYEVVMGVLDVGVDAEAAGPEVEDHHLAHAGEVVDRLIHGLQRDRRHLSP